MIALNPKLPPYSAVQKIVRPLDGVSKESFRGLLRELELLRGTQKSPHRWSDEQRWMADLATPHAELAKRIWRSVPGISTGDLYGSYLLINKYELMSFKDEDVYKYNSNTEKFCSMKFDIISHIDRYEGIIEILNIMDNQSNYDLIQNSWRSYCSIETRSKSESNQNDLLRRRCKVIIDRGIANRYKRDIFLTENGKNYLTLNRDLQAQVALIQGVEDGRSAQNVPR